MSINPRIEAGSKAAYGTNRYLNGDEDRFLKWEELDEEERRQIRYQVKRVIDAVDRYDTRLAMIRERG